MNIKKLIIGLLLAALLPLQSYAMGLNAFTDDDKAKLASIGNIAGGYFIGPVSTTVTTAGTYYKVVATFTQIGTNGFTWNDTDKRWDYAGSDAFISVFGTFIGSHDDAVAAHACSWKFYKNGIDIGTPPAGANIEKNDSNSITLMAPLVAITDGDYIELYATIDNSGDSVIVENMNFAIR